MPPTPSPQPNTDAAAPAPGKNTSPLRTYQSDVENALKSSNGSLVKIALAENEKKLRETPAEPVPVKTGTRLIVIVSAILIFLGAVVPLALFLTRDTERPATATKVVFTPIVSADLQKEINLSKADRKTLIAKLESERKDTSIALSTVVNLYFTEETAGEKKLATTERFFEKLGGSVPSSLVRSFEPEFTFGIHSLRSNHPFFIFKVTSYQNAFGGMLAWEKTLEDDLGGIFFDRDLGAATATTTEQILRQRTFEDVVVRNRDARVLKNEAGEIIFLYAFADKATLIVTTYEETLKEILDRLVVDRLTR